MVKTGADWLVQPFWLHTHVFVDEGLLFLGNKEAAVSKVPKLGAIQV